ncbi:MAG: hypothetical protein KDB14_25720 [Planctomycetales bacterium]|nr:hypothetical protein [Planctomycetales bacterium]
MRFVPPPGERISPEIWKRAYVTGLEGIPFPCRCIYSPEMLTIVRDINESGSLHVPYPVDDVGELVLSTTSLAERPEPYLLELELARGTINRLRNQSIEWEMAGLKIAADLQAKLRHSTGVFARAASSRRSSPDECQTLSAEAIRMGCRAIDRLGEEYGRQALAFRHQQTTRLATLLTGDIGMSAPYEGEGARRFCDAFNSVSIPVSWKSVEEDSGEYDWTLLDQQVAWAEEHQVRAICLGPIFNPRKEMLPDWIYLWEDDFDQLQSRVSQFLQQVVLRYRGRVLLWQCATGLNLPLGLSITEEQRLRLAVRTVEAIRQADPRTPIVITFEDPWGEYLTNDNIDLSPLHFADALVRADLGLSGVGLRIDFGEPGGLAARDPLEISRLIDRWGLLDIPLMVTTSIVGGPSQDGRQPSAQFATPAQQALQAKRILPILLAKQAVHGIIWGQIDDRQPHQRHAAGLFDASSIAKPVLETLADLRQEHLS